MRHKEQLDAVLQKHGLGRFGFDESREAPLGDYSSPAGFELLKREGGEKAAREVGSSLEALPFVRSVEQTEGFINVRLADEALHSRALEILKEPSLAAKSDAGKGKRVSVEFVSANPTGPLNVVSARAAAVGDSTVRALRAAGYDAESEYYVNDRGGQVERLGESVAWRLGLRDELPEGGYGGDYLAEVARGLKGAPSEELGVRAAQVLLEGQMETLRAFGAGFDTVVRESEVRASDYPDRVFSLLAAECYEEEGALMFRATKFGDSRDRVLKRSGGGEPTYLLYDCAYHLQKADRGFGELVVILGPDHHGHIPSMEAGLDAMGVRGYRGVTLQQVNMTQGGKRVKVSKRGGTYYALDDLLEEVGRDAARWFFVARKPSSLLDFDITLAKTMATDNPVYYAQYVHARGCSLADYAKENGVKRADDLSPLVEPQERALLRKLLYLPEVTAEAGARVEPHRITSYITQLAKTYHNWYQKHRVVTDDARLSGARLALSEAARVTMAQALELVGVGAPARM